MKKTIAICMAALLMMVAPQANAQSLLDKAREKAQQAAEKAAAAAGKATEKLSNTTIGGKLGSILGAADAAEESSSDDSYERYSNTDSSRETSVSGGKEVLQPKRSSSFGWNGAITPSKAEFPVPLMNEFPALPKASQLANPDEAEQIAFYKAIKAVTLRAEELNASNTCEDIETEKWRKTYENAIKEAFGLSDADMALINSGNMTEAEEQRITEKMQAALLGGANIMDLENLDTDDPAQMAQAMAAMGNMMSVMGNVESKLGPLMEMQTKYAKYVNDIANAFPISAFDSAADAKFSSADAKKVENIKNQIYNSSNADCDALFQQVSDIISTYRERAAQVWLSDVQKRYDAVKNSMAELIKINRQAVADEIIPECALWRIPLNAVINAGDILAEAYSEFPCNYPPMYNMTKEREVTIDGDAYFWVPEFYVVPNVEDMLSGKNIIKCEGTGTSTKYYKLDSKGSWVLDSSFDPDKQEQKKSLVKSETWTSKDGKRKVIYNAEGGFLQLPEGDIVYPSAVQRTDDGIIWCEQDMSQNRIVVYKCYYKI